MAQPTSMRGYFRPFTVALALALGLWGCTPPADPATTKALMTLAEQQAALESRLAKLEAVSPAGDAWVLWQSSESLQNQFTFKLPTAESAFATQRACLESAAGWKAEGLKQVAFDPVVFDGKGMRYTLRCLPKGVDPVPKR
jgi:hypothetical protein